LSDGLVVNDYTLSRPESFTSFYASDSGLNRSRSISPVLGRSIDLTGGRGRSPKITRSINFERQARSQSPQRYLSNEYDGYIGNDGKVFN
jgi:hypothetical protein